MAINHEYRTLVYREYEISSPDIWLQLSKISTLFIFRGQSDREYGLSTTIERGIRNQFMPLYEVKIIEEFRRRANNYISSPPSENNILEWLAMIQHYGGPTRLLDFTRSYFIASFFALSNKVINKKDERDVSIWAINTSQLISHLSKKVGKEVIKDKSQLLKIAINNIPSNGMKGVFIAEPFEMNNRLFAQQGLFVVPINLHSTYEENLFSTFDSTSEIRRNTKCISISNYEEIKDEFMRTCIIKINIPHAVSQSIVEYLHKMNINYTTIYPDLEGLARSLYDITFDKLWRDEEYRFYK